MFKEFTSEFWEDADVAEIFVSQPTFEDAFLRELISRFGGKSFNQSM
jgi:hypothetical protein